MTAPENTRDARFLRALDHMVEASSFAYALTQELAHMVAELAPLTGGPLEPVCPADKAYPHLLNSQTAAHRIIRDIAAIAATFDTVLADDADEPITRLSVVHPAGSAIGFGGF